LDWIAQVWLIKWHLSRILLHMVIGEDKLSEVTKIGINLDEFTTESPWPQNLSHG